MRGYFKERSGFFQLAVLITVCICSLCFSMFVNQVYLLFFPDSLRATLLLQNSLPLFLTAVGTQYLISGEPFRQSFGLADPGWLLPVVGIATLMASGPFIEWLNSLNHQLTLPASLKSIETWMIESEQQIAALTARLLNTHTVGGLLLNLLQIAVLAGVCEELLFRGVIQKIMIRWTGNLHAGIWIAAFVFSAIHLQFFGFLPRLFLGAVLGYLFALSGTLWIAILAHIANNALAIFTAKIAGTAEIGVPGEPQFPFWLSLVSLALVCAGLVLTRRCGLKANRNNAPQEEERN